MPVFGSTQRFTSDDRKASMLRNPGTTMLDGTFSFCVSRPGKQTRSKCPWRRVQDWPAFDQIVEFVHAVGRVGTSGGSAVLIALTERYTTQPDCASDADEHAHTNEDDEDDEEDIMAGAQAVPMGLLLTTSFVLPARSATEGTAVHFLEQPVAGTAARLGGNPVHTLTLPLRADCGFVTSLSERQQEKAWAARKGSNSATTLPTRAFPRRLRRRSLSRMAEDSDSDAHDDDDRHDNDSVDSEEDGDDEDEEEEEVLGYSMTFCEFAPSSIAQTVTSDRCTRQDNLRLVKPLPLPLLLSTLARVRVGDVHLWITHLPDRSRRYLVRTVTAVETDYCEYEPQDLDELMMGDTASYRGAEDVGSEVNKKRPLCGALRDDATHCSGGPVFNAQGQFIGLQHQRGRHGVCLLNTSIVRNLFAARLLGLCHCPVAPFPLHMMDSHEACCYAERIERNERISPSYHPHHRIADNGNDDNNIDSTLDTPSAAASLQQQQQLAILQPSGVADIGTDGSQLVDFAELCRIRQRVATLSLRQPPSFEAVYAEYYSGFESLCCLMHAFPHCRPLVVKVLQELVRPDFAAQLVRFSALGGMGSLVEILDGYPHDVTVIVAALSALAQLCLHPCNLINFVHLDGVVTVLELAKELAFTAPHPTSAACKGDAKEATATTPRERVAVMEWGLYVLGRAGDAEAPQRATTMAYLMRGRGDELAWHALQEYGVTQRHMTLWATLLLMAMAQYAMSDAGDAAVVAMRRVLIARACQAGVLALRRVLAAYAHDTPVLQRLMQLLHTLLQASYLTSGEGNETSSADAKATLATTCAAQTQLASSLLSGPLAESADTLWHVLGRVCESGTLAASRVRGGGSHTLTDTALSEALDVVGDLLYMGEALPPALHPPGDFVAVLHTVYARLAACEKEDHTSVLHEYVVKAQTACSLVTAHERHGDDAAASM